MPREAVEDTSASGFPFPFIVARGRSGTTLLRAMLDAHPDFSIPPESPFIAFLLSRRSVFEGDMGLNVGRFVEYLFQTKQFVDWQLDESTVRNILGLPISRTVPEAIRRLYAAYAMGLGKARYGDKTPSLISKIRLIGEQLPEARFIHLLRDPRDNALSYLDVSFGPDRLDEAVILWRRLVMACRHVGKALGPNRYLEIRYEDLVSHPEATLQKVCMFINLDFDPTMLDYPQKSEQFLSRVGGDKGPHQNVKKSPTRTRDWRQAMNPADIALVESIAGGLMTDLGYETMFPQSLGRRVSSLRREIRYSVLKNHRLWARRLTRRLEKRALTNK